MAETGLIKCDSALEAQKLSNLGIKKVVETQDEVIQRQIETIASLKEDSGSILNSKLFWANVGFILGMVVAGQLTK